MHLDRQLLRRSPDKSPVMSCSISLSLSVYFPVNGVACVDSSLHLPIGLFVCFNFCGCFSRFSFRFLGTSQEIGPEERVSKVTNLASSGTLNRNSVDLL